MPKTRKQRSHFHGFSYDMVHNSIYLDIVMSHLREQYGGTICVCEEIPALQNAGISINVDIDINGKVTGIEIL